jgi:hypothetical protein
MRFPFDSLSGPSLDAALQHFEEQGFFIVEGLEKTITSHFKPIVAERLRVDQAEFERILDPDSPPMILPVETRERLSRVTTPPELGANILRTMGPVFSRLIGPLVHISTTFHAQFKGGDVKPVDHGGYDPKAQYLEVQGQYLIHQDFSGAALPTSPSGITLWVALNSCPDWNLRLYPGSHRHGLLCNQWLPLEDPRLKPHGAPVDIQAKTGIAVIFNSLLLHSSSNPGPKRRLSCDIRFFPLCGFLPSQVHALAPKPGAALLEARDRTRGITLRSPILEALAFLGQDVAQPDAPAHSNYDWVNYLNSLLHGDPDGALPHLARFVHPTLGVDGVEAYAPKFHNRQVHASTLRSARERIAGAEPSSPLLAGLNRLISAVGRTEAVSA